VNLHQLRIFSTVARLASFSRAAETLHISQPSVSIQVADLERSLGVELFEQLGKRIYLTDAGRVLESYAQRILTLVEEAQEAVAEVTELHRGRLAVGASTTPGTYILPKVLGRYEERFPKITVTLEIASTRRIQERLLRSEIDIGVVGWVASAQHFVIEPLLDDDLVVVVSAHHPLATSPGIPVAALADHRLILRERGSGTREAIEAAMRSVELDLTPAMELGSVEAIKEVVAAGLGVTILSRLAVAGETAAGRLAVVPVTDLALKRAFSIIYHRDKRLSPAIQVFLEMLRTSVIPSTN
jgi:DNA-binding transcriptional LysR family regulator